MDLSSARPPSADDKQVPTGADPTVAVELRGVGTDNCATPGCPVPAAPSMAVCESCLQTSIASREPAEGGDASNHVKEVTPHV